MAEVDKYIRTRKCGCGECRFLPKTHVCALENSPTAIWLWATNPEWLKTRTYKEETEIPDDAMESLEQGVSNLQV